MCPPPSGSVWKRLRHDFANAYYRAVTLYIAIMVTVIAVFTAVR